MKVTYQGPSSQLTPYIRAYYTVRFNMDSAPADIKVFPVGNPQMIFYKEGEVTTYIKNKTFFFKEPTLHGHILQHFKFKILPKTEFSGVAFTPLGMYKLLGANANDVRDCIKPLSEFVDNKEYRQKVMQAKNDEEVAAAHDAFFLEKLDSLYPIPPVIDQCIEDICAVGGEVSIDKLAKKYNCSRRYLEKHFSYGTGNSPGNFAKRIRFLDVIKKLETISHDREEQLSNFNFYNRAHFLKDFRYYLGEDPYKYFKNAHPQFDIIIRGFYLIIEKRKSEELLIGNS